jgi:methylamine dehydrogenase heavy chain
MRVSTVTVCVLMSCVAHNGIATAGPPLPAETIGTTVLERPEPSWFMLTEREASYIFDGADGEVKGLISHTPYTPAVVTSPARNEAYLVDSYYSRGVTGTRTDVLTIVDLSRLSTAAEVDLPAKTAALHIRQHVALLDDDRHVAVFNMTPAQSVSIVDVIDREFAGEISTPGCAIIMPAGPRGFLMLCGDGTLQLIELDGDGRETNRVRSRSFFDVEKDPVFDRVTYTGTGWLLVTHDGLVREVRAEGDEIRIGDAWSMLTDEDKEAKWRPGGEQPFTVHRATTLLYALMHQGEIDTQDQEGTEIWVYDTTQQRRVARLPLPVAATNVLVSQESSPRLYVVDTEKDLHIYDARLLRLQRTTTKTSFNSALLQTLTPHD